MLTAGFSQANNLLIRDDSLYLSTEGSNQRIARADLQGNHIWFIQPGGNNINHIVEAKGDFVYYVRTADGLTVLRKIRKSDGAQEDQVVIRESSNDVREVGFLTLPDGTDVVLISSVGQFIAVDVENMTVLATNSTSPSNPYVISSHPIGRHRVRR